jgi:Glucose / Sorbosone dehydrogenase
MRFIGSLIACIAVLATGCGAEGAAGGVQLRSIGTFAAPVYLTAPPGDGRRLFVVEQAGTIRLVRDGRKLRRPFLDLRSEVLAGGERGLLSMAFSPDYARSGLFYVYFTGRDGDIHIDKFRRAGADRANRAWRRELLRIEHSTYAAPRAWSRAGCATRGASHSTVRPATP